MAKRLFNVLNRLVPLAQEEPGKPRIHEDGDLRCLHFAHGTVQSAMRVSDPYALDLNYTRSMAGFALFNAEPRHILLVGLGGGSLSKFCYREFPQARVTTLEINPEVIALRGQFLIPADDGRFRVVQADACEYLATRDIEADVILLDGYDAAGMPECLCTEDFYGNCWRALGPQGVLVANLLDGDTWRAEYLDRLRRIFDGRVWWSKPRQSRNLIVFAVKNERYYPQWSRLMAAAQALDARYRLDLVQVVRDMRERPDPEA